MGEKSIVWSKSTLFRLFTSSAASILVVSLGTLLITRIYTPSEFGKFSFVLSLAMLIAPLLTTTYEIFIVPSQTEEESLLIYKNGCYRALKTAAALLMAATCIYLVVPDRILDSYVGPIILAIMLALIYGIYNLITQIALRRLDYATVSSRALIQNGTIYSSQLALGNLPFKGLGLIIGEFIGRIVTIIFISKRIKLKPLFILQRPAKVTSIIRSKIISNTTATIFEIITASSLFFYIYLTENQESSGNFAMAQKLLTVPIILFGTTTAQYLFANGSHSVRLGIHMTRTELDQILKRLAIISLAIGAVVFLFGSLAIDLILNSNWESVGSLIALMSPYFVISLIWTQLSFTFYTKDMWRSYFFFASFRFCSTTAVLLFCYLTDLSLSVSIHLVLGINSIISLIAIGFLRKKH